MSIENGVLYVVATPIGNLGDMSARARQVLAEVQLIAAEDTRHSGHLLRHFGISTPMLSLHEHNELRAMRTVIERLRSGQSVALISDAGTPLISDPGFPLVRGAREAGIRISPVPGPNAAICALSAAGLPTDRFMFEGFLPRGQAERRERLERLQGVNATLVFYESGQRLQAVLGDMREVLGGERPVVLARELTKIHETLTVTRLEGLEQAVSRGEIERRGEMVILVGGSSRSSTARGREAERVLGILLNELPVKQAATLAARITGARKNDLYALALKKNES